MLMKSRYEFLGVDNVGFVIVKFCVPILVSGGGDGGLYMSRHNGDNLVHNMFYSKEKNMGRTGSY